jgi:hypothetical protein
MQYNGIIILIGRVGLEYIYTRNTVCLSFNIQNAASVDCLSDHYTSILIITAGLKGGQCGSRQAAGRHC